MCGIQRQIRDNSASTEINAMPLMLFVVTISPKRLSFETIKTIDLRLAAYLT